MSKVLVDRELLEALAELGEDAINRMGSYLAEKHGEQRYVDAARAILAQPAEAEGVSNARLMNTLAELARRAPLRTLHTICETQSQVSTVKLERYLEPVGDTLAGYAVTLRIDFDKLSAALSAVTAERDGLVAARTAYASEFAPDKNGDPDVGSVHANIRALKAERDQLRAEVEALRNEAASEPNIYRAVIHALRRAADGKRFGTAKVQRTFLLGYESAVRLIEELARRGDIVPDGAAGGEGWAYVFPDAAMAAKEG